MSAYRKKPGFSAKMAVTAAVFFLICMLVFTSCASSSGTLFEEMTEKDEAASEAESEVESEGENKDDSATGIYINSEPEDADVYLNGFHQGTTPLLLEGLKKGEYSIKVTKPGYKTEQWWITYEKGDYLEYETALSEVTGYLSTTFSPEDAVVYLGRKKIPQGLEEVQIGTYPLTVKAFGYEPFTENIVIKEDETTIITGALEPADLNITETSLTKEIFNPENPGTLGSVTLTFEISKPAEGTVTIFNEKARAVAEHRFAPFTTWEQSYTWNGTDDDGSLLPDGTYTLFIEAEDETDALTATVDVQLDSTRRIQYSSTLSGIGGLLYCPSTDILPLWSSQIGVSFLGHVQTIDGTNYYRVPIQAALRISPLSNLELNAGLGVKLTSAPKTPISIHFSGKYQFANWQLFRMAVTAKGTFVSNDTEDTLTNFTGFSAGLPLELAAGPFRLLACPEFIISPLRVAYLENESYPVQPVYVWNYFRTGIALRWKYIGTGISAAFRMRPYTEGFQMHWPAVVGAEFHFIIPNTQIVLVVQGAGEIHPELGFYLLAGIGAALLN